VRKERVNAEGFEVLFQRGEDRFVAFQKGDRLRATAQGIQAHGTRAGEEVQESRATEERGEEVKERFTNAILRWAHEIGLRHE
jgi:hypothetical protein